MRKTSFAPILIAAALVSFPATSIAPPVNAKVTTSDRKFLAAAAQGRLAEVELGKMAADRATNADVKAFGQHMVDDHSKANEELKKLAESKGIAIPSGIGATEESLKQKLARLSDDAFDRAYVDAMVSRTR